LPVTLAVIACGVGAGALLTAANVTALVFTAKLLAGALSLSLPPPPPQAASIANMPPSSAVRSARTTLLFVLLGVPELPAASSISSANWNIVGTSAIVVFSGRTASLATHQYRYLLRQPQARKHVVILRQLLLCTAAVEPSV
jgi:hypothetical protein